MASEHPEDLLAAYSLDAVTDAERTAVARHVAACSRCRDWLSRYGSTTEVLALSIADAPAPRTDLRDRILAAAATTAQVWPVTRPSVVPSRSRGWSRYGGWLAAAALFVITLGVGVWNYSLQQQIQALQPRQSPGLAMVATADAPGAGGTVVVQSDGALLTVASLPPPPAGKVFEAWVIDKAGAHAAGSFGTTSDGRGSLQLTQQPAAGDTVAVTTEPSPGLAAPTGKVLLKGTVGA